MMNNHQSEGYKKKRKKILTYVLTAFISSLVTVGIILLIVYFIVNDMKNKMPKDPSVDPSTSSETYNKEKDIFNKLKAICEDEVFSRGKRNFTIDNFTDIVIDNNSSKLYIGSYSLESSIYCELKYSFEGEVSVDDVLTTVANNTFSLNLELASFYTINTSYSLDKQPVFKELHNEKYSGITYNFGQFKGFSGIGLNESDESLFVIHNVYLNAEGKLDESQACAKNIQKDSSSYYNFMRYLITLS